VINDPEYAHVAADLRTRLQRWMEETSDPLLDGPVPAPPGAQINAQDQLSAEEPTFTADGAIVGAAGDARD
jgi:N-sulfoglucosamine sulfohydrolase